MRHFNLLKTMTSDGDRSRVYVDGKRTSFDLYDDIIRAASMSGKLECFLTTITRTGRVQHRVVARY